MSLHPPEATSFNCSLNLKLSWRHRRLSNFYLYRICSKNVHKKHLLLILPAGFPRKRIAGGAVFYGNGFPAAIQP